MSIREAIIMLTMCVVWGFHFVVIKFAVAEISPLFYAAVRMTLVAALLAPFLRWRPGSMVKVIAAGLCLGCFNYAFLFTGLKFAPASASAIALELYAPFATILSVVFLGEVVRWRRIFGIVLAFSGVVVITASDMSQSDPQALFGISLIVGAAFSEAVGAILVKTANDFKPIQLLAWFALSGAMALTMLTLLFDAGHGAQLADANMTVVVLAILYSALAASIFGHTSYYWLLQRLPMAIVSTATLLTSMLAVMFSIIFLGEPLSSRFFVGGLMTLVGVAIILMRNAETGTSAKARHYPDATGA
ncbi:MAG: EamA family transporter [Pseudomonadota bacterium]